MKEPDPTDDLDQTILETFDEMHAEAQITPIFLTFPPEVVESVEAYTREHSLESAMIIPLAIKAMEHQLDEFSEAGAHLMEDPDSFTWPFENPLLCVALAFMLKHACRCAEKVHQKQDFGNDEQNNSACRDGKSRWPLLTAHGMSFDFDVLFRTPKNHAAQSARGRAEP
jgi:hypothetical protein